MKFRYLLLALLVVLPLSASAAGFAKQSLFLSKEPVTEGETVLIHAIVANDTTTKFDGDVVFKDADTKIGSVAVTIAAGGANAVSVSWKPSAGSHEVTAELTLSGDVVVAQESATFTIDEKPKPAATSTSSTDIESSQNIQNSISQYVPQAAGVTTPVFSTIDAVRAKAAAALDSGIAWAKDKSGGTKPGEVLGDATSTVAVGGVLGTLWSILALIALYTFMALRFIVGSAGIFYPLLAIVFFFILWRTYKHFRRPSYG